MKTKLKIYKDSSAYPDCAWRWYVIPYGSEVGGTAKGFKGIGRWWTLVEIDFGFAPDWQTAFAIGKAAQEEAEGYSD